MAHHSIHYNGQLFFLVSPKFLACCWNIAKGNSSEFGGWWTRPLIVNYCCSSRQGNHRPDLSFPPSHQSMKDSVHLFSYPLTRHMGAGRGAVDRFLQANSFQDLLPDHTCHPCHPPPWRRKSCLSSLTMTPHGTYGFTQTTHRPQQLYDLGVSN